MAGHLLGPHWVLFLLARKVGCRNVYCGTRSWFVKVIVVSVVTRYGSFGVDGGCVQRCHRIQDIVYDAAVGSGRSFHASPAWLYVRRTDALLVEHGWKLHISTRLSTMVETLDRVLPVLVEAECDFKTVPDVATLAELNSGRNPNPGSVGKAITAYPRQDPKIITELAGALVDALREMAAPVVRSDRRVHGDAPVYYRYGPFLPRYRIDDNGRAELVLHGPGGEEEPGGATREYRCPSWAVDPFLVGADPGSCSATGASPTSELVLGGKYEVRGGIQQRCRGSIYRAQDFHTGEAVIVKEAYAWIDERYDGQDARTQLRNERRVLHALDGLTGVPRFVDHFRHGQDEYLTLTELPGRTLRADVATNGAYLDPHYARSPLVPRVDGRVLADLATRLVALLDAIHGRGVIVRDLSPKNVLVAPDGEVGLIDFECAGLDGVQCPGFTPGYAPPEQRRNAPARMEDDYYALGATLYYAATGLDPVLADDDQRSCPARTLEGLVAMYPALAEGTDGVLTQIPALLSDNLAERRRAASVIRDGQRTLRPGHHARSTFDRARVTCDEDRLDATIRLLLMRLQRGSQRLDDTGMPATASVYDGSSGVALGLLRHPDATSRRAGLVFARHAARSDLPSPPPGLMSGATGTAVALAMVATRSNDTSEWEDGDLVDVARLREAIDRLAPPKPAHLRQDTNDDYTHGLAGIGTGHLLLAELTGDHRHDDVAAACANRLRTGKYRPNADVDDVDNPGSGASVVHGFAHGTAGVVNFLVAYRNAAGVTTLDTLLEQHCATLIRHTRQAVADTTDPRLRPLAGSWCRGLPGLGTALLHAGAGLDRPDLTELALEAGEAATRVAPRMQALGRCCGLAGLGAFLLELAEVTGSDDHWHSHAWHVAALILARRPDPMHEPELCWTSTHHATNESIAQNAHTAGVLSFLHQLRHTDHDHTNWHNALYSGHAGVSI